MKLATLLVNVSALVAVFLAVTDVEDGTKQEDLKSTSDIKLPINEAAISFEHATFAQIIDRPIHVKLIHADTTENKSNNTIMYTPERTYYTMRPDDIKITRSNRRAMRRNMLRNPREYKQQDFKLARLPVPTEPKKRTVRKLFI